MTEPQSALMTVPRRGGGVLGGEEDVVAGIPLRPQDREFVPFLNGAFGGARRVVEDGPLVEGVHPTQFRREVVRGDAVDPDLRGEFVGQLSDHPHDRVLGRRVEDAAGTGVEACVRRREYHVSLGLPEGGEHGLGSVQIPLTLTPNSSSNELSS